MICNNCGNDVGNSKFCSKCGNKILKNMPLENANKASKDLSKYGIKNNNSIDSNQKSFNSPAKKGKFLYILAPFIIFLVISFFFKGGTTDSDYISCAQTLIKQHLTSPSSAKFSNGKVLEKDDYGRRLITLTVESQNGFGVYLRDNFAVVITSYDKKTGEFTYKKDAIMSLNQDEINDLSVDYLKTASNWNEPIEEE